MKHTTSVRAHARRTKGGMSPVRGHTRAYTIGYNDAKKVEGNLLRIPYPHYVQFHKSVEYMDGFQAGQRPFLKSKK